MISFLFTIWVLGAVLAFTVHLLEALYHPERREAAFRGMALCWVWPILVAATVLHYDWRGDDSKNHQA